eukprot:299884_1
MSFTFDLLKENEILSMHDRQQQPINKLTPIEQFYTDVSKVYDHQLKNDNNNDEEDEDENDINSNESDSESQPEEEEIFSTIIDNLDKARYQLDEMCRVIDMLTTNNTNELEYKLSNPLTYPPMNRQHFCAISHQKTNQFTHSINIFTVGIKSIHKRIEKNRNFSKNLTHLSQYWRLSTRNILQNDSRINMNGFDNKQVFIDYRVQRKQNKLNIGLLPLNQTHTNGNVQIYINNQSELIKYLQLKQDINNNNNNNKTETDIIGFDDDDDEFDEKDNDIDMD